MASTIQDLLNGNAEWVDKTKAADATFFDNLAKGQSPNFLWIGCADSRVPATQVTNSVPGSIFVQRNIANLVVGTDANLISVVNYAVKALRVKHIIICGHYGCGGVKAAMSNSKFGYLDGWLSHIKSVYRTHRDELEAITDEKARFDRYVELNVQEQVLNMARISMIQEEWENNEHPHIHGWVYGLHNGLIKDLNVTINSNQGLDKVSQFTPGHAL